MTTTNKPPCPDAAAEDKSVLRKKLLALRAALSDEQRAAISLAAQNHLQKLPAWQNAAQVMLYSPVRNELDTAILMNAALASGKQVLLPRCLPQNAPGNGGCMEMALCRSPAHLRPGRFKIPEPDPALCPAVTAADLAPGIAVIPGLAFTRSGLRLGYGGGYYDRFFTINPLPDCLRVGFCAGLQLLPTLPASPWDVQVDGVCTEAGFFPAA